MFGFVRRYFDWLDGSAPKGNIEIYPVVSENYKTNIDGIYIIGDLTGIPLLKLAVASGQKIWNEIPSFDNDHLDAVIIGAGPSGIACALEAKKRGRKFVVLESNETFQTIRSYPKGKPIYAEPKETKLVDTLLIRNGTKESLLEDLKQTIKKEKIKISENQRVTEIIRKSGSKIFEIITEDGNSYLSNQVIIAMGKSGDPNRLGIKGENLSHVFYRLIDPKDAQRKHVVIVGGGDSAVEAAIATSKFADQVTLVYRNAELNRPKPENTQIFNELVSQGKIQFLNESQLTEITENFCFIKNKKGSKKIKSDFVLILAGSKPPLSFLNKLGIRIQNLKTFRDWIGFTSLLSFALTAYFGKASFYGISWYSFIASASAILFLFSALSWFVLHTKQNGAVFPKGWNLLRNFYLCSAGVYFLFVYFGATYFDFLLFGKYPAFHYTMLYSTTILFFGIRRIQKRPTSYIKMQTCVLIFIQLFFLFLLPEIILPSLGKLELLGSSTGFLRTQVFPNDAYWKAYGFILAWPLNMAVLYDGNITSFWFGYGIFMTFGIIPYLVLRFGKGAYCGWICSCGGLAETLGDEHRHKMPHGKWAYKLEHSGQWILLIAFIITFAKLIGVFGKGVFPSFSIFEIWADSVKWIYDLVVDIGLAGVVGVGFYFLFSGRIWCRMFCPLASLMHIYAKFTKFRIFSENKKCISCNICTKNCHQGIDVMNYANKGIPMDSVQCVRCSACVSMCPTGVLSFGALEGEIQILEKLEAKSI